MQWQNNSQSTAESLALAGAFLALNDGTGRYSVVFALACVGLAVLLVLVRSGADTQKGHGTVGCLVALSTLCVWYGEMPVVLALWPAIWGVLACGESRRAWASLMLLPLSSTCIMWLTVQIGQHTGSAAPATVGPMISVGITLAFGILIWRAIPRIAGVLLVGMGGVGMIVGASETGAIIWSLSLALVAGSMLRLSLQDGKAHAWGVTIVTVAVLLWWVPYGSWITRGNGQILILLPEASSLSGSVFARTESAFRHRFPDTPIVHDAEHWPTLSTVLIPWIGHQEWNEEFWTHLVHQAEEKYIHLVVMVEHTNLTGFRDRMVALWSTYGLIVGDDTTVPRPNRDFLGHVWQATWRRWDAMTALNRGGSIKLDHGTARPILIGRDWFADGPGGQVESGRLGDYRPTNGEQQFDVVLAAYGISPSRRSMVTVIADNSPFVETNVIVQPPLVLERFTDGPASAAALDLFLVITMIAGWLCSSGKIHGGRGFACLFVAYLSLLLLPHPRLHEERSPFHEPQVEPMGYADNSSAQFRLWWLGLKDNSNNVQVVIGTWKDLALACETSQIDARILYLGLPEKGTACGASVDSVFRFGRLEVQTADGKIPVQDGAWAHLTLADGKEPTIMVGDKEEMLVATWEWEHRKIAAVFDKMVVSPAAFRSPSYQRLLESMRETLK